MSGTAEDRPKASLWRSFAGSLAGRLALGAAAWVALALLIAGFALSELYRQSTLRALDRELAVVLDGLTAGVQIGPAGAPIVPTPPNDARFSTALSGRYWQIAKLDADNVKPARSASLWDERLSWPGDLAELRRQPGQAIMRDVAEGPYDRPARLAAQIIAVNAGADRLLILAAFDRREAESDITRFRTALFAGLGAIGAGLILAAFLQVTIGLRPLNRLQSDIADIREGRANRLTGDYPSEVAPLTGELNALIDHNAEVVLRARTHVGNLAHALKTPLSVILNETRADQSALASLVRRNAEAMGANIDHYLKRAQAAARAETIGARTPVRPAIADIARMLEKLYGRAKDLDLLVEEGAEALFRGERQDLDDMVGNLMENACKYGGGQVHVQVTAAGARLIITVEDDGPGLAPEQRERALARGARLDESAPGQGLGLSIVAELARMYGGALALDDSPLGGLKAHLVLPAAP